MGGGGFRWFEQCPKENVFFQLRPSLTKPSRFENVIGFKFQIKRFRARVFEYSLRLSELSWHLLLGNSSLLLTAWEGRALEGETEVTMIKKLKLIWLKHQHLELANWLKMMASPCVWDILIVIDSLGLRLCKSSGRFRMMRALDKIWGTARRETEND